MACLRIPSAQVYTLDSGFLAGSALVAMMGGARSLLHRTEGLTLICNVTPPAMSECHVHMSKVPRQQRLLAIDLLLSKDF